MERFIISVIFTWLISAAASPAVQGSKTAMNPAPLDTTKPNPTQTSPSNLVSLADRGDSSDREIPSSQAFISTDALGNTNAQEIVQTEVETRRSPNTINDQGYINAVESMLNTLKTR